MGPSSFRLYYYLEIVYSLIAVGLLLQSLANLSESRGGNSFWYLLLFPLVVVHGSLLMYDGVRKEIRPYLISSAPLLGYGAYLLWPLTQGAQHSAISWAWLFGIYSMLVTAFCQDYRSALIHGLATPLAFWASAWASFYLHGVPVQDSELLIRLVFLTFCCLLLSGLPRFALNAVREADKTYYETLSAQLLLNRSRDYAQELQNFDKLVHDNVMAALLDASRRPGPLPQRTQLLARRAIGVLEEEALKTQPQRLVTFQALTEHIAEGVEPWGQRLRFVADPVEDFPQANPESTLPHTAARAFTQAVTEAVSNSARHSKARTTYISIRTETRRPKNSTRSEELRPYVICTVSDKGVGFSMSGLDFRRLGVRVSMIRSMEEVGGLVHISSAPENGTTVTIQWPNENA